MSDNFAVEVVQTHHSPRAQYMIIDRTSATNISHRFFTAENETRAMMDLNECSRYDNRLIREIPSTAGEGHSQHRYSI